MIAVDTNILVYAHRRDSPFHAPAAGALRGLAEGRAPWAIGWPCLREFFSVTTHPRIYDPPATAQQACDQVDAWLESPSLTLIGEGGAHWTALRDLLVSRAPGAEPAALTAARARSGRFARERQVCLRTSGVPQGLRRVSRSGPISSGVTVGS